MDVTMSELSQHVAIVLELSRALLVKAEAGEWPDMPELEQRRLQALQALFAVQVTGVPELELLIQTAEAVRSLDDQTLALVVSERDRAAGELRKLQLGRQGGRAYLTAWDE